MQKLENEQRWPDESSLFVYVKNDIILLLYFCGGGSNPGAIIHLKGGEFDFKSPWDDDLVIFMLPREDYEPTTKLHFCGKRK